MSTLNSRSPIERGEPTCIACAGELALFGPYGDYKYFRCRICHSIQLSPMPDEETIARAYRDEYIAEAQTPECADPDKWRHVSKTYRSSLVQTLKDHRIKGPVVDFGAGWGFLLETMIENGFDARGVEISKAELEYAKRRGLPVEEGGLEVLGDLEGQISAIVLSAVFEHLVNHGAVLSAANRLLNEGGFFVTLHPTAAAFNLIGNVVRLGNKHKALPDLAGAFTAPWHTALFSLKGTDQIISRYGFRLLEIRPAPQGRLSGALGLVQRVLELSNKVGWALMGTRWPLVTTHIFVYQKTGSVP